jgi:hypothetical protein
LPLRYSLYELTKAGPIWLASAESMDDVAKQLLRIVRSAPRDNPRGDGMAAEEVVVESRHDSDD